MPFEELICNQVIKMLNDLVKKVLYIVILIVLQEDNQLRQLKGAQNLHKGVLREKF